MVLGVINDIDRKAGILEVCDISLIVTLYKLLRLEKLPYRFRIF